MQRLLLAPLLALLPSPLFITLAGHDLPGQRGFHVESRLGLKFRVPAGWKRWPAEKDRRFVRGFYVASRSLPVRGLGEGHRPTLRVLVLPKPPEDPKPAAPTEKAAAEVATYADYRDYLARNLSGTLLYQSTKKSTLAGRPCVEYRIRRRTENHAYRLQVWVLDFEQHSVALEFYVHESHASGQERLIAAAIKSLRRQEPDPKAVADPWRPPLWEREPARWKALPFQDRIGVRTKYETDFVARVRAELAPGFKLKPTKHFLLVSRADARFTNAIGKAADACFDWCVEHLDGVSDDPVIRSVIRIFPDGADEYLYRSRSARRSDYVPAIREVVLSPGRRAPKELTGIGELNRAILHMFLEDKARRLHENTPAWLRDGMRNYLYLSKLSRGKIAFEVSDYERQVVREARRGDHGVTLRAIMQQQIKLPESRRRDRQVRYHRGRGFRFLLQSSRGRGAKIPKTFLTDYLIAVRAAQEKFGVAPRNPGAGVVPGWVDADREAAGKARDKVRQELLETVGQVAVPWTAAEWAVLEKAYTKFNKSL